MTTRVRTVIAVIAVVVAGQTADADMIVNGSLTGSNHTLSLIPPGWATLFPDDTNSTPDTEGANGPHETYNLSPDGGTFVAGAHATLQAPLGIEGIQQALTGLSVGQQYRLDFYETPR